MKDRIEVRRALVGTSWRLTALGMAALALTGCAALSGAPAAAPAPAAAASAPASAVAVAPTAAVPKIVVPPTSIGTWRELGYGRAPWLAGDAPVPVSGVAAPTRAMGLQREDGRWLAVVVVQAAPSGTAGCPLPTTLDVPDAGHRFGTDCLRMQRGADMDQWLERQHSLLWNWLQSRELTNPTRIWVGHRVDAGGRLLEAHALVDPSLLEPVTRTTADFLHAGQSGLAWARQFGEATRVAAGSGTLNVPPFPFASRLVLPTPVPVVVAPASAPRVAAPVVPPPLPPVAPVRADTPRADRQ